jgi:hypothetical protein
MIEKEVHFSINVTTTKKVTMKDIRRSFNSILISKKYIDKRYECLNIISDALKKYRWEIFKTFDAFKIVINGYKQLKYVEMADGTIFKKDYILDELEKIMIKEM